MENLLIKVFLGHLIGDFIFQFNRMADNKYRAGWKGIMWCSIHVFVYTLIVATVAGNFSAIFLLGVFLPHWVIDRWSLAFQWMKITGSAPLMTSNNPKEASFGAIIYVAIDQTAHYICLYLLLMLT